MIKRIYLLSFILVVMICVFSGGCGNKGPLYLPDEEPVMQPATEPDAGSFDSDQ